MPASGYMGPPLTNVLYVIYGDRQSQFRNYFIQILLLYDISDGHKWGLVEVFWVHPDLRLNCRQYEHLLT